MTTTPEQIVDSLFEVANEMKKLIDDTYDENVSAGLGQQLDEIYEQYESMKK